MYIGLWTVDMKYGNFMQTNVREQWRKIGINTWHNEMCYWIIIYLPAKLLIYQPLGIIDARSVC